MGIELEPNNNLDNEEKNDTEEQIEAEQENIEIEAEETEKDKITLIGEFIREKSSECKLSNAEDLLEEPFSLEVDEVLTVIDELKEREEFKDIYSIKGEKVIYLFSDKYISNNYAKMMILVEEKDLLKLVAETVRFDSKAYPRPTDSKLFSYNPFKLSEEEFNEALNQLKTKPQYSDIKETRASNNALYLYSDTFLSKPHADSLAEWIAVGQDQNP